MTLSFPFHDSRYSRAHADAIAIRGDGKDRDGKGPRDVVFQKMSPKFRSEVDVRRKRHARGHEPLYAGGPAVTPQTVS